MYLINGQYYAAVPAEALTVYADAEQPPLAAVSPGVTVSAAPADGSDEQHDALIQHLNDIIARQSRQIRELVQSINKAVPEPAQKTIMATPAPVQQRAPVLASRIEMAQPMNILPPVPPRATPFPSAAALPAHANHLCSLNIVPFCDRYRRSLIAARS